MDFYKHFSTIFWKFKWWIGYDKYSSLSKINRQWRKWRALAKSLIVLFFKVFCGKIPKDVFEDELIPLFEKCGAIWDLRLMMDPMTGFNRGYSFITYCDRVGANEAVKQVCIINLL